MPAILPLDKAWHHRPHNDRNIVEQTDMRMMARALAASLVMATISACAGVNSGTFADREATMAAAADAQLIFDPTRNASADVDAALAAARENGKHVMIILGGDWCHDSMALFDLFQSERFAAMLSSRYELVWVHVPRSLEERNIAVARRFGLGEITGTPTVLILDNQGTAINLADAPRWRNAASRKPEAVYRHFARAVAPVAPS